MSPHRLPISINVYRNFGENVSAHHEEEFSCEFLNIRPCRLHIQKIAKKFPRMGSHVTEECLTRVAADGRVNESCLTFQ